MGQFDTAILTKTGITPDIALRMRIDQYKRIRCPRCQTISVLGDIKPAMFLYLVDNPLFRPPALGGNGWNFHCPNCQETIHKPRW